MESDNWILMKQEGQTQPEWLKESLDPGAVVGFDPYLFTATGMVKNTILHFCLNLQGKQRKRPGQVPSALTCDNA